METTRSSETSILKRTTQRKIPGDAILQTRFRFRNTCCDVLGFSSHLPFTSGSGRFNRLLNWWLSHLYTRLRPAVPRGQRPVSYGQVASYRYSVLSSVWKAVRTSSVGPLRRIVSFPQALSPVTAVLFNRDVLATTCRVAGCVQ
jgi:hypothetical protein